MRYFLCPGKTDMRKGINSLCGVVHDRMGHDVRLSDVFIFINRSRSTMKLLHAEDGGMVLYVKRLEEDSSAAVPSKVKPDGKKKEFRRNRELLEGLPVVEVVIEPTYSGAYPFTFRQLIWS